MSNINKLNYAVSLLEAGELVAFPTETVYGLGADATNNMACNRIFSLKKRPSFNPLIIHVSSIEQAQSFGLLNTQALQLVQHFWPGPLTVVVPLKDNSLLASAALAGLSSVALRMPLHPLAIELIDRLGRPIAAPSANISGQVSSTEAIHVIEDFKQSVYVLDNNDNMYGLESTIVDCTITPPALLRLGFITAEDISAVLHTNLAASSATIKAPGMLARHYSPNTPLRLEAIDLKEGEIGLNFGSSNLRHDLSLNLSIAANLMEAAANLYKYLRTLDKRAITGHFHTIAVAPIIKKGIGATINDKLMRASISK